MIVRVESPALVSTCSTTTAGGTSTGGCGRGRAEVREGFFCACSAGASVPSRRAPARSIRVMRGSIYLVRQFYTSPGLSLRGQRKTTEVQRSSSVCCLSYIAKPRRDLSSAVLLDRVARLLGNVELKRHLHELLYLFAPDLRRREFHAGERFLDGGGES